MTNKPKDGFAATDLLFITQMTEQYGITTMLSALSAIAHDKAEVLIKDTNTKDEASNWEWAGDIIDMTISVTSGSNQWPS